MDYGQQRNPWAGYYREQGFSIPMDEMEYLYNNQPTYGGIMDLNDPDFINDWLDELVRLLNGVEDV